MVNGFLFIIGLVGLWFGTSWVVKSAVEIAEKFNFSHAFVGLAILSVGTDLPEVFVTLNASFLQLKGIDSSGIITGNAIGSAISQISIVLGISGLLLNFSIAKKDLIRDGAALFISIVLVIAVGYDGLITRMEGILLLVVYMVYYILLLKTSKIPKENHISKENLSNFKLTGYLLIGFIVLIYSSHLVVSNAMIFAEKWGVAQTYVGIILIGLGTSLPELAVSIGAAMRKSVGMSVGNIIGSNIFDTLIIIGLGSTISPILMDRNLIKYDLLVLLVVTMTVVFFLNTKKGISKIESIVLIGIYLLYIMSKLW